MAETGHAVNVANFTTMISRCTGFGVEYDPSNADLTIAELGTVLDDANTEMNGVSTKMGVEKVARNTRADGFAGIRKLTTRAVNSFEAGGASQSAIADAKTFKRKLDGARAKTLIDDPDTPEDESQGNSVSQQSYTQLIEHLDNLISVFAAEGSYNPNETELKLTGLNAYSNSLKTKNSAVLASETNSVNARMTRNASIYGDNKLFDRAALVKKYVKSLYGADSPQFKQISGLEFTKPRNV